MRQQNGHYHALTLYEAVNWRHFLYLWWSLVVAKLFSAKSLTAHLPLEIQHPGKYTLIKMANRFISWGEFWKKLFRVNLYWENAPLLIYGSWKLKHGQTAWRQVPKHIWLCLDTGHLIQGSQNPSLARKRIRSVLKSRGAQVKHLHLHENDLIHDNHWHPKRILTKNLLKILKKGRTFIYEKG